MTTVRKALTVAVAVCFYEVSLAGVMRAASFDAASIQQRIADFGVGAKVALKLAGGRKVKGLVEGIDSEGLLLAAGKKPATRIAYDSIAQVKLAQRAYHAKGQVDPIAARRVVVNLGVGRHAVVKFDGRELHGNIQAIAADHFTLLPDNSTTPVEIAYNQVHYVEKNLTFGATVVLLAVVVAAVVVVAIVATRY